VDVKRVAGGCGFEVIEDGEDGGWVGQVRLAFVAADRDEVIAFAEVVFGGEADVFALEGGHLIVGGHG
jgi:hypothetical protein